MRKSQLICFRDKMRKKLVYVLILQFKGSCFFHLETFTPTYIVFGLTGVWGKLTPKSLPQTSKHFTPSFNFG